MEVFYLQILYIQVQVDYTCSVIVVISHCEWKYFIYLQIQLQVDYACFVILIIIRAVMTMQFQ